MGNGKRNISECFNDFIRGNESLGRSYWLYFSAVTYGTLVLFSLLAQALRSTLLVYIFTLNISIWCAFSIHGVWKSSEKYIGKVFWKYLARVAVVCGSAYYISNMFLTSTFIGK